MLCKHKARQNVPLDGFKRCTLFQNRPKITTSLQSHSKLQFKINVISPALLKIYWFTLNDSQLVVSLFTDLLFSQMIVERANENKNRERSVTATRVLASLAWSLGLPSEKKKTSVLSIMFLIHHFFRLLSV